MTAPACTTSDLPPATWDVDVEGETMEGRRDRLAQALAVCAECPVLVTCRQVSAQRHEVGVWGGKYRPFKKDAQPDRDLSRERNGQPGGGQQPIKHGTTAGLAAEHRRGIPTCAACREAQRVYKAARRAA